MVEKVPGSLNASADPEAFDSGLFGDIRRKPIRLRICCVVAVYPDSAGGAPHQRQRIFLVAHTDHPRWA